MSKKALDDRPLEFGKYKGLTPQQIAEHDPSYIVWMYDTVKPKRCSKALAWACEQDLVEEESEEMDEIMHRIIFDE